MLAQFWIAIVLASLRLTQVHSAWGKGESPLATYHEAPIYDLRYNRFPLDEILSGSLHGTHHLPVVVRLHKRSSEGRQLLVALSAWWQSGTNEITSSRPATVSPIAEGMKLTEAEHLARQLSR